MLNVVSSERKSVPEEEEEEIKQLLFNIGKVLLEGDIAQEMLFQLSK